MADRTQDTTYGPRHARPCFDRPTPYAARSTDITRGSPRLEYVADAADGMSAKTGESLSVVSALGLRSALVRYGVANPDSVVAP